MSQIELDVLTRAERALNKLNEVELRDVFAMQAMNGLLSGTQIELRHEKPTDAIAEAAYKLADAMLEARKKK